jgi:hypothetical protein
LLLTPADLPAGDCLNFDFFDFNDFSDWLRRWVNPVVRQPQSKIVNQKS